MTKKLKILMYHGIISSQTKVPELREPGADLYDVKLRDFKQHLRYLKDQNLKVGLMGEEGVDVVITFDDGEANNYEEAFSVLKEYQFPAYFFIIAKRVGKDGYMNLEQLKTMHQAGMIIGSHGFSHEILTNLKDTQVEQELTASKKFLSLNLDIAIDTLSIPRGFCDQHVLNRAKDAGYKTIFVSDIVKGAESECYERIAIKGSWDQERFEQAIKGNIPLKEKIIDGVKRTAKFILRDGGYNLLRNLMMKI